MGIKILDNPDNPQGMRLEWWEDNLPVLTLDLDERLPMNQWQHAEKVLLHYHGEWIFDPKSQFHEWDRKLAEDVKEELRLMAEKEYVDPFRSVARPKRRTY